MNKNIKKRWIKALRSGKYEQGYEYLCTNDRYCCLGVLHDVAGDWWYYDTSTNSWGIKTFDGIGTGVLSKSILNEVGLTETDMSWLINLNDSLKLDFNLIAELIKENL